AMRRTFALRACFGMVLILAIVAIVSAQRGERGQQTPRTGCPAGSARRKFHGDGTRRHGYPTGQIRGRIADLLAQSWRRLHLFRPEGRGPCSAARRTDEGIERGANRLHACWSRTLARRGSKR